MVSSMSRQAVVPEELRCGPFTVAEAMQAGLTRRQLRSASWRRISTGLYVWAEVAESPTLVLAAVCRRLPPGAAFSGRTAAWLHGLDVPPCDPVEVTVPCASGVATRAGVRVRRSILGQSDVVVRRGLPATSILRTVFDLSRWLPFIEAVVAVDMALHRGLVDRAGLRAHVAEHPPCGGLVQARRVVELAEPAAESPMESRLRILLVRGGLPRPHVQVPLRDDRGGFVGRPDLYYPAEKLAIEFDGGTHRDSLVGDNRRQNRLLNAGYRLLRFTAADVYAVPNAIVAQVRAALGAPKVSVSTNGPMRRC
jgi:very-short-patch-repair endonuclease